MSEPLTAGTIFRHQMPAPLRVEVPELGGYVYVRLLTAGERGRFESSKEDFGPALVALCACDEAGKRLFDDGAEKELMDADGRVIYRIAEAAIQFNALRAADREQAAKNS